MIPSAVLASDLTQCSHSSGAHRGASVTSHPALGGSEQRERDCLRESKERKQDSLSVIQRIFRTLPKIIKVVPLRVCKNHSVTVLGALPKADTA